MSSFNHLPLYLKLYQFEKHLYLVKRNFSKQYKYSMGEDLTRITWECLDLFVDTNALVNEKKHESILKLSATFDKLKLRVRMCQELNLVSEKQFAHIQTYYVGEIGMMIGGWLKWAKENFNVVTA